MDNDSCLHYLSICHNDVSCLLRISSLPSASVQRLSDYEPMLVFRTCFVFIGRCFDPFVATTVHFMLGLMFHMT